MRNINAQKGIAPVILLIIMGLIAVGGVGAGYGYVKMKKAKETKDIKKVEQVRQPDAVKETGIPEKVAVKLDAQNNSGISGVAVLALYQGKVRVAIETQDPVVDATRPAHIHLGKCPTPGEVKYPLSPVVGGISGTTLDISWGDMVNAIRTGTSMAVNVHKSAAEASVYVSCGDIVLPGMTDQEIEDTRKATQAAKDAKKEEVSGKDNVAGPEVKSFDITAQNFSFSVKEIRVKKGDKVRIDLNVAQGYHDWVIDEFNARTKQMNGPAKESIQFVADKVGTFEYYCSVGSHRAMGMVGKLIVE